MGNLKQEIKQEIKLIETYFNFDKNYEQYIPQTFEENRLFDSGYIFGLIEALKIIDTFVYKNSEAINKDNLRQRYINTNKIL